MKKVKLRNDIQNPTIKVLTTVMTVNPETGCTVQELRQRIRVLDAIEASNGDEYLKLEDADWQTLQSAYSRFQFAITHRDLVTIADDIEQAEEA